MRCESSVVHGPVPRDARADEIGRTDRAVVGRRLGLFVASQSCASAWNSSTVIITCGP
jgi:hypothetical protein